MRFVINRKLLTNNLESVMIFMNFVDLCMEYFEQNMVKILKINLFLDNFLDRSFIKFHYCRFNNFKNFD